VDVTERIAIKLNSLLIAVLAAGILPACENENAPSPTVPPAAVKTVTTTPGFEKLKDKWVRPDGGCILEIRKAAVDGKLEANARTLFHPLQFPSIKI